ncbi:benzoate/H(+) symporter BenE family transporter [Vibrio agarivorans]|uniref:Benzoate/H(+) symporter BenE family transporter n=1 Tax=Vibrio agarivorans TaxID=153622 RepID=A0ABT7Y5R1_9VIBR|nr:benzoate/H(+) symporter BenE family transporter [Vibrio agarivorans]MDN2483385.1 benzoate/H(+) symporter BenE family transporter [Vibrio agarivorans]
MLKLDHITAGLAAVIVGYTSAIIIVIQAAQALGATSSQIESWLLALGLSMGVGSFVLSYYYKIPILIAWSTPGAALLITLEGGYSIAQATPAFVVTGVMIALTGLVRPLNKALSSIPPHLASAMLAAILLPFCINAFTLIAHQPLLFITMFVSFIVAKVLFPKFTMLTLLVVGIGYSMLFGQFEVATLSFDIARPEFMGWQWDHNAIINIAVPLYLLTMLSQNLPGFAMLKNYDYPTPTQPILVTTGLVNALFAFIGGFSLNLAAITASLCMNESVDKQPQKRYLAAMWGGVFYIVAGLWGTAVVSLFMALPKEVSQMLAGLALLGTLTLCLKKSLAEADSEPALITFLITLSGVSIFGLNSTLLGLTAGWLYMIVKRREAASLYSKSRENDSPTSSVSSSSTPRSLEQ